MFEMKEKTMRILLSLMALTLTLPANAEMLDSATVYFKDKQGKMYETVVTSPDIFTICYMSKQAGAEGKPVGYSCTTGSISGTSNVLRGYGIKQ